MEPSANRIERFTAQLRDQPKLANPPFCPKVDAVLLESADGSVHLKQVKRVLAAEKACPSTTFLMPVWKMRAWSARLAPQAGVPWLSSSSFNPVVGPRKTILGIRWSLSRKTAPAGSVLVREAWSGDPNSGPSHPPPQPGQARECRPFFQTQHVDDCFQATSFF